MHWSKLGAVAAVVAAAVSGFLMVTPPRGEGLDAPADRYSAARAHALVAEFADRPHLIGSPANALVRDRIVAAFEGLGLTVETRTTRTVYDHPRRDETRTRVAWPENIIARLPGDGSRRGPGEALALMSHYDSVPTGHGAADAMSGVASIIEALRAIKASGQLLERDVVVIITDGEEVGLLGAQAFFRTNPLHEEIGLLLNFEARGAAGVASMFETGPDNAGWVREFGRAAPRPDASSVSVEIYRRMPNDTDATITLEAGIPFLNFAFIDDYFRYHAGADVAANLSQRSLQHEGDNLLALLNHFGREDWPESRSDATYFTAAPGLLVVYGSLIAWLTVIAAVALAGLAIVRLVRRNRWFDPLLGAGAVLAAVAVALGVASGLYQAARAATPSFHLFYQYDPLLLAWVGAGVATLAAAASSAVPRRALLALLVIAALLPNLLAGRFPATAAPMLIGALLLGVPRRPLSADAWVSGGLLLWLLVTLPIAAIALHGAYVFSWPLAFAAAAVLWATRASAAASTPLPVWPALVAIFTLWLPLLQGLYLGIAITLPGVISAVVVFTLVLAWPLFRRWSVSTGLAIIGVTGLVAVPWSVVRDPFTPEFPQPVEVFLAVDAEGEGGWWMTRGSQLNDIERAALGPDAERFELSSWAPLAGGTAWRVPAPPATTGALAAPATVNVLPEVNADGWRLRIYVRPSIPGARLVLALPEAGYETGLLGDAAVPLPVSDDGWRWDFWGTAPQRPIRIEVTGTGALPGSLTVDEYRYAVLDAAGIGREPRPDDAMARPWSLDRSVWLHREIAIDDGG